MNAADRIPNIQKPFDRITAIQDRLAADNAQRRADYSRFLTDHFPLDQFPSAIVFNFRETSRILELEYSKAQFETSRNSIDKLVTAYGKLSITATKCMALPFMLFLLVMREFALSFNRIIFNPSCLANLVHTVLTTSLICIFTAAFACTLPTVFVLLMLMCFVVPFVAAPVMMRKMENIDENVLGKKMLLDELSKHFSRNGNVSTPFQFGSQRFPIKYRITHKWLIKNWKKCWKSGDRINAILLSEILYSSQFSSRGKWEQWATFTIDWTGKNLALNNLSKKSQSLPHQYYKSLRKLPENKRPPFFETIKLMEKEQFLQYAKMHGFELSEKEYVKGILRDFSIEAYYFIEIGDEFKLLFHPLKKNKLHHDITLKDIGELSQEGFSQQLL